MSGIDEAILLKMAEAEILGEARRAAVRHSVAGVSGWQPCPKPNKMFLTNTLLQTMASNRIQEKDKKVKGKKSLKCNMSNRKLLQKNNRTDMTANYIYQKPKKNNEKHILCSKSRKHIKNKTIIRSEDRHSKGVKEKFSNIKVKLKKLD